MRSNVAPRIAHMTVHVSANLLFCCDCIDTRHTMLQRCAKAVRSRLKGILVEATVLVS